MRSHGFFFTFRVLELTGDKSRLAIETRWYEQLKPTLNATPPGKDSDSSRYKSHKRNLVQFKMDQRLARRYRGLCMFLELDADAEVEKFMREFIAEHAPAELFG